MGSNINDKMGLAGVDLGFPIRKEGALGWGVVRGAGE